MTSHLITPAQGHTGTSSSVVNTNSHPCVSASQREDEARAPNGTAKVSERPLRVVHLLGGSEGGGITTAVAALLGFFDRHVVEASVVILRRRPTAGDARLPLTNIHYLPKTRGKLGTALKLAQLCRRERIDILHTHSISSNFYGRLAGLLAPRTRVVTTVHARTRDEIRGSLGNARLEQFIAAVDFHMHRGSQRLIAVSAWLRDELIGRGVRSDRIAAVCHGIPPSDGMVSGEEVSQLRASLQIAEGSPVIAIVGRLTPVKNHDLLLQAAARLQQQHPRLVILIVGDGARRTELMECARHTLPPGATRFVGWVEDVTPYLHLSDLLVACSRSEGFGYTVLEAMACGTPVVATDVAALPEIVRHGETGLLVPADDATALAEAISQLLRDPRRRARMGQAAREDVVCRFSLEQEVAGTLAVYQHVLKEAI